MFSACSRLKGSAASERRQNTKHFSRLEPNLLRRQRQIFGDQFGGVRLEAGMYYMIQYMIYYPDLGVPKLRFGMCQADGLSQTAKVERP